MIKENAGKRGGTMKRAPDPTPLQIRIACKKAQRSWTTEERHARSRYYQG
jgi:hypothetical protein